MSRQDRDLPSVQANKPSSSFSTVSSAASATSAATSRSGCSKLLFGEIDLRSDRSSESYVSVCSFVLSKSGTFLKFWLADPCRERLLSYLPKVDLASLRVACHDFSVRAAPALFADLSITFKTSTFTKPARLAALDRLGFYVKTVNFNIPHTAETVLPPLIESETGDELSFTYTPQLQSSTARQPKYGDIGTTQILTRQYPALFHAATNVPAFVRAFSSFINLEHLTISSPGHDYCTRNRRSIVDFVLISLRMAVEQNRLYALKRLTLSPIHPGALQYLSPLLGYGATPRSMQAWSRIQHLTIRINALPDMAAGSSEPDHLKLLQNYFRSFQPNLTTLNFSWLGERGPLPVRRASASTVSAPRHPAMASKPNQPLRFPKLKQAELENIVTTADEILTFVDCHKGTIEELNFENNELISGTWAEALAPMTRRARRHTSFADIPIMLSLTTPSPLPARMERVESRSATGGRPSLRLSKWLSSRKSGKPAASRRVREGMHGCEEHLKKVLGGVLPWK